MPNRRPDQRRRRRTAARTLPCVAALVTLGVAAATAAGQNAGGVTADPGGTLTDPAASGSPQAKGGKVPVVAGPPKPLLITCRTACAGLDRVPPGGRVRVTGDAMSGAQVVVFKGEKGSGDDTRSPAIPVSGDAVDATVPGGAVSGPVQIIDANGSASRTTGKTITVLAAGLASTASAAPDARVDVRKVFFRGPHQATLSVFVPAGNGRHVSVDLVRDDHKVVGHWERDVSGATVESFSWNGLARGSAQRDGRYRFRVTAVPAGASAAQSGDGLAAAFSFLGHIFPIRGPHEYGTGAARFGAGRAGHTHQGQDVFAACGTPLVAARGGTVKFQGAQSAAGNYVVIDGAGTGTDYVYMHLKEPALVAKGDTVYTGQPIGEVGDTGDANGCHLHLELWKAPGWYTGGSVVDPLPSLQRWDKQS